MERAMRPVPLVVSIAFFSLFAIHDAAAEAAFSMGRRPDGSWMYGFAYNFRTRSDAARTAVRRCEAIFDGCMVVHQFNNSCAALARQDDDFEFAVADHPEPAVAEADAIARCERLRPDSTCTVEVRFCDGLSESGDSPDDVSASGPPKPQNASQPVSGTACDLHPNLCY
jgi:hypothetical protein